jgi:sugar O-acyltransferase (sialic acid O-acetyltransferase NeuD family)
MTVQQIAVYGAGGFAREVAWLVQSCNGLEQLYEVVCFIDDNPATHGTLINGIPSMNLDAACRHFPEAAAVIGIGAPQTRQKVAEKVAASGLKAATIVHPRTEMSDWIEIGEGTVICAGNILTTNIILGKQVQINLDCTVGHDVIMEDYATLAPGVHISGCVHLGKRVYVGTGAVIINGTQDAPLVISDDAIVGAAACVTKSVSPGVTVVGVPAKPLQRS